MATKVKYVSDADGNEIEVIVPIALWREMTLTPNIAELLNRSVPLDAAPPDSRGNEGASTTYIGTDEVTGLPVFIAPPGSPTLTLEDETTCLLNGENVKGYRMDSGERTAALSLEEAGIDICKETGLPVFRMPVGAPQISTEFIRSLEDEW